MKKYLLFFIFCFSFLCCDTFNSSIIERDSIGYFSVEEQNDQNNILINISGHIMHSAINYKKIKIRENRDSMYILLYGTIFRKTENSSGTFSENIIIKENIDYIYFGNDKIKIWERK